MHFQAKIKINEWIEEGEVLQVVAEIHLDKDRDAKHLMGPVGLLLLNFMFNENGQFVNVVMTRWRVAIDGHFIKYEEETTNPLSRHNFYCVPTLSSNFTLCHSVTAKNSCYHENAILLIILTYNDDYIKFRAVTEWPKSGSGSTNICTRSFAGSFSCESSSNPGGKWSMSKSE